MKVCPDTARSLLMHGDINMSMVVRVLVSPPICMILPEQIRMCCSHEDKHRSSGLEGQLRQFTLRLDDPNSPLFVFRYLVVSRRPRNPSGNSTIRLYLTNIHDTYKANSDLMREGICLR